MKKRSDQYLKIVEWSNEDNCYIGSSPGLFWGGVHGEDQTQVFQELCTVIDEIIMLFEEEQKPLPPSTANKKYSGKISLRIPPELHKTVAIKAIQTGESVNKYIRQTLEAVI